MRQVAEGSLLDRFSLSRPISPPSTSPPATLRPAVRSGLGVVEFPTTWALRWYAQQRVFRVSGVFLLRATAVGISGERLSSLLWGLVFETDAGRCTMCGEPAGSFGLTAGEPERCGVPIPASVAAELERRRPAPVVVDVAKNRPRGSDVAMFCWRDGFLSADVAVRCQLMSQGIF